MSPSANAESADPGLPASTTWSAATPRRGAPRSLKCAMLILAVFLLAQYLAGFLLLWSFHIDAKAASPLTLARYAYYYGDRPEIAHRLWLCFGAGIVVIGLTGLPLWLPKRRSLHGDARFARLAEIRGAGLLAEQGVLLGKVGRRYLTLGGQQGVALAAPPRAGKGTGIVVPNLLNWSGSLVCIDIKRENWQLTAGYREHCGQACYLFDPFSEDGRTTRWNPFTYVSEDPRRRLNDLQRIAEMLYPDPPNVDPFWTASARSLFLGISLYLFETPSLPRTIGEVLRQGMASNDEGFGQHWKRIVEGRQSNDRPLTSQCVRALYNVIDLAPVTASSIRVTFTSRLDLWLNPILDAATSASDFDLRELRSKPISLYIGVNPDDLHRLRPVLNLLCQQAIGLQTRELPERNPALRYQVLMMLDEFTALGRIPIIAEAISYLPGYNVRVVLVIQALAQLREVYGIHSAETMLKSLAARIMFAPKDFADAREISDELGFLTVKAQSISKPLMSFDARSRRSRSVNVSEQRRALLLPQEVKELGTEEALITYEGLRPIRCRKIRYYKERVFRERLMSPPPLPRRLDVPAAALRVDSASGKPKSASKPTIQPRSTEPEPAEPQGEETFVTRDATIADVDRIDSLKLSDYARDLSLEVPEHEGRLSEPEMDQCLSGWMDKIR
jgi:type IV secretion system protein VirD4